MRVSTLGRSLFQTIARPRGRVALLAALLIGGQAAAIASGIEMWPFSPYSMYAYEEKPVIFDVQLIGIGRATGHKTVQVPIDCTWLHKRLIAISKRHDSEKRFKQLLRLYVNRSGWKAKDAAQARVAFTAFRIYRREWNVQADAGNRGVPDRVELLAEMIKPIDGVAVAQ